MVLRKRILKELEKNQMKQKAFALVIYLKQKLDFSRIENNSRNKLSKVAGIAHDTAAKLEKIMFEERLVHFEGSDENRVLVLNSFSSKSSSKNVCIDCFDFASYKSVLDSLQAFIIVNKLVNMKYVKQLYHDRHNPKNYKQLKSAFKKLKGLTNLGVIDDINAKFNDNSISLATLAEVVGCSVKKVQKIVQYAIKKKWIKKRAVVEQFFSKGVNFREIEGFTFTTKNNLYIVHPNAYTLSGFIKKLFSSSLLPNAA